MNVEAYIKFWVILLTMGIITLILLAYAIIKKDFSKKMDTMVLSVFVLDGFVLLLLMLNTWF